MHSTRLRSGVSLVETLVVIGVVALLAALVLPAVNSARESMRRTQCLSQLAELGKANASFVDAKGNFPQWSVRHSAFVSLLPWLQQDVSFTHLNLAFPDFDDENQTHFSTRIALFVCPSDSAGSVVLRGTTGCSYAANAGTGLVWHGYDGVVAPSTRGRGLGLRDVTDGLGRTALFAEQAISDGSSKDFERAVWNTTFVLAAAGDESAFRSGCRGMPAGALGSPNLSLRGRYWLSSLPGGSIYNHLLPPGQPTCANGTDLEMGAVTSGSSHGDVVHCVFVDGHAAAISKAIDERVWAAMGSRNGGESL